MAGNQPGTPVAIAASLEAIMNPRTPNDRDVAEWQAASDIALHPNDYAPKRFLFPDWELVRPWFELEGNAIETVTRANPSLFGRYRHAVLEYEGACAKQLESLAWAARTLYRMRDKPGANVNRIDAASSPIESVLSVWGVPDTFLRDSTQRGWAMRFVQGEYVPRAHEGELLPRSWRHL